MKSAICNGYAYDTERVTLLFLGDYHLPDNQRTLYLSMHYLYAHILYRSAPSDPLLRTQHLTAVLEGHGFKVEQQTEPDF